MSILQNPHCIYCQSKVANSKDHIPSKGLFPDGLNIKFKTVPACTDCNTGYSSDEEFFRAYISAFAIDVSKSARALLDTKIKRATQRRPGLARKIFETMSLVDVYSPNGIYLGKQTRVAISQETRKRIDRVIEKYVKALFYFNLKKCLPQENKIRVVWLTNEKAGKIPDLLNTVKLTAGMGDVFAYGYSIVPDSDTSIWLMVFWNKIPFIAFITDNDFEKEFPRP